MLLAIDIGNTTVAMGLLGGRNAQGAPVVRKIPTRPALGPDAYMAHMEGFLRGSGIMGRGVGCVACSVVPEVLAPLTAACMAFLGRGPVVVGARGVEPGFEIDIEDPGSLGPDRVATTAGALEIAEPPLVVVDFGTATTINFIENGARGAVYMGGAIMPGLGMMASSLSSGTSLLPEVGLGREARPLGRTTEGNILSGILLGTAGAVERIIALRETERGIRYGRVFTGGAMGYVIGYLDDRGHQDPWLVMRGLGAIHARNSRGRS